MPPPPRIPRGDKKKINKRKESKDNSPTKSGQTSGRDSLGERGDQEEEKQMRDIKSPENMSDVGLTSPTSLTGISGHTSPKISFFKEGELNMKNLGIPEEKVEHTPVADANKTQGHHEGVSTEHQTSKPQDKDITEIGQIETLQEKLLQAAAEQGVAAVEQREAESVDTEQYFVRESAEVQEIEKERIPEHEPKVKSRAPHPLTKEEEEEPKVSEPVPISEVEVGVVHPSVQSQEHSHFEHIVSHNESDIKASEAHENHVEHVPENQHGDVLTSSLRNNWEELDTHKKDNEIHVKESSPEESVLTQSHVVVDEHHNKPEEKVENKSLQESWHVVEDKPLGASVVKESEHKDYHVEQPVIVEHKPVESTEPTIVKEKEPEHIQPTEHQDVKAHTGAVHVEYPVVEHPVVEHKVVEHPVVEHPVVEHKVVEHPVVEHKVAEPEHKVVEKPAEHVVVEHPVAEHKVIEHQHKIVEPPVVHEIPKHVVAEPVEATIVKEKEPEHKEYQDVKVHSHIEQPVAEHKPAVHELPKHIVEEPTIVKEREPEHKEHQDVKVHSHIEEPVAEHKPAVHELPKHIVEKPTIVKEKEPEHKEHQDIKVHSHIEQPVVEHKPTVHELPKHIVEEPTIVKEREPEHKDHQPVVVELTQSERLRRAEEHIKTAMRLKEEGKHGQAVNLLQSSKDMLNPDHFHDAEQIVLEEVNTLMMDCTMEIADCYNQMNDFNQSVKYARVILKSSPGNVKAAYLLGIGLLRLGDLEEATTVFRNVKDHSSDEAYGTLIHRELEKLEQIAESRNKLQKATPHEDDQSLIVSHNMGTVDERNERSQEPKDNGNKKNKKSNGGSATEYFLGSFVSSGAISFLVAKFLLKYPTKQGIIASLLVGAVAGGASLITQKVLSGGDDDKPRKA